MAPETHSLGDHGPSVDDLKLRLRSLGYEIDGTRPDFDQSTEKAVLLFQRSRGLESDGTCGEETWRALFEADFSLGDRLLFSTHPMMRGEDVSGLQLQLGQLGFDAGRVDGIFGPNTEQAVTAFQRNAGIICDGVAGPESIDALIRMASRGAPISIAGLRERERLRSTSVPAMTNQIAIVYLDTAHPVVDALAGFLGSELGKSGSQVAVIVGPNWSSVARDVNEFEASVCIAIDVPDSARCEVAFFKTDGFESYLGAQLADAVSKALPSAPGRPTCQSEGKRIPVLRETRAPAVLIRLGPPASLQEQETLVAAAIHAALITTFDAAESAV